MCHVWDKEYIIRGSDMNRILQLCEITEILKIVKTSFVINLISSMWWYQPVTFCWLTHYYGIWGFLGVSLLLEFGGRNLLWDRPPIPFIGLSRREERNVNWIRWKTEPAAVASPSKEQKILSAYSELWDRYHITPCSHAVKLLCQRDLGWVFVKGGWLWNLYCF